QRDADEGLQATLQAQDSQRLHWLRYFHRWPDQLQWARADRGLSLADVHPYESQLITDFYAYNTYLHVPAGLIYRERPSKANSSLLQRFTNGGYSEGVFHAGFQSDAGLRQFGQGVKYGDGLASDGMHWVGDLIFEVDVETSADAQELVLELVEAGIEYRCRVDLTDGTATLGINDIDPRRFVGADGKGVANPKAETSIRAGDQYEIRFSNCDDELLLWVDGDLVSFDGPTTFDSRQFRTLAKDHPQYLSSHPLDAAPVGIAVRGGEATIDRLRVDRDKYYIATRNPESLTDYDHNLLYELANRHIFDDEIQQVFKQRESWATFIGWQARQVVEFPLEDDQFFPMGDNSPESLDARCWADSRTPNYLPREVNKLGYKWSKASYVPRDLLVGKALVVFWPHSWNSPVPFMPNVKRMKLIR
ncbi:MAG: S26 family signal peptidase, partial [Pirellulales bacterium]|nr:S26 family signal peptidase [Pirellulales bacterium]